MGASEHPTKLYSGVFIYPSHQPSMFCVHMCQINRSMDWIIVTNSGST